MYRRKWANPDQVADLRRKIIGEVFPKLRKEGMICRANFSCCQSCGGYEIAEYVTKMMEKERAKVMGTVFWHRQDEEGLQETGDMCLAFGQIGTQKFGDIGLTTVEVGTMLVNELTKAGVDWEWNGTEDERVRVMVQDVVEKQDKLALMVV